MYYFFGKTHQNVQIIIKMSTVLFPIPITILPFRTYADVILYYSKMILYPNKFFDYTLYLDCSKNIMHEH
jgi:hypothetical protein